MYWLPKLHKRPYEARFIANSSSCTTRTTELSKFLTSWLTAVKSRAIRYYEKVYERSSKNMFWSIKILARYLVNWSQEVSVPIDCPIMIFPLFIPHYHII